MKVCVGAQAQRCGETKRLTLSRVQAAADEDGSRCCTTSSVLLCSSCNVRRHAMWGGNRKEVGFDASLHATPQLAKAAKLSSLSALCPTLLTENNYETSRS